MSRLRFDRLYNDYEFSQGYPRMGKIWKIKCHFCGKDLRKVPKQSVVKGEVTVGFGEDWHIKRRWWCNEECAKEWYLQQWVQEANEIYDLEKLRKSIKGGKNNGKRTES